MSQVVLFYSNHCQHSKTFVSQIQDSNIGVNKVCVDSTPRDRIPSIVRSVPTLILAGQAEPLVGDAAFEWLKAQQQKQQQQQQKQASSVPESDGPMAWHMEEMGGASFSDGYSFLDSHTATSIPKNFAFLDGAGGPGGGQGQSPPGQSPPGQSPPGQQPHGQQPQGQQPQGQQPQGHTQMMQGQRYPQYGGGGQPNMNSSSFHTPPELQQRSHSDDLSQRMESMQAKRDNDIPRGNQGGGNVRFEDLPLPAR